MFFRTNIEDHPPSFLRILNFFEYFVDWVFRVLWAMPASPRASRIGTSNPGILQRFSVPLARPASQDQGAQNARNCKVRNPATFTEFKGKSEGAQMGRGAKYFSERGPFTK